jgi:enoyl-[acyl-carrier-protein] reductase (NADH)
MIPAVKAKLLEGKRGLVVGIANGNSSEWGNLVSINDVGFTMAFLAHDAAGLIAGERCTSMAVTTSRTR